MFRKLVLPVRTRIAKFTPESVPADPRPIDLEWTAAELVYNGPPPLAPYAGQTIRWASPPAPWADASERRYWPLAEECDADRLPYGGTLLEHQVQLQDACERMDAMIAALPEGTRIEY